MTELQMFRKGQNESLLQPNHAPARENLLPAWVSESSTSGIDPVVYTDLFWEEA